MNWKRVEILFEKVLVVFALITITGVMIFSLNTLERKTYSRNDLHIIKGHIMNEYDLSKEEFKRCDVNQDGEVGSLDYVIIKNYLLKEKGEK